MQIKKYCVTVMDNWTPTRTFWTEKGARKAAAKSTVSYVWWWNGYDWIEI